MNTLQRIDLKKTLFHLYTAPARKAAVVDVPAMQFLAVDGSGHPAEQPFQEAASAVYPLAYLLKFAVRERLGIDYGVMPMEVTWNLQRAARPGERTTFTWTLRLMQPEWVTEALVTEIREKASAKVAPELLERVRFETATEGLCGQILHIGPYEGMNDTLARMTAQLREQGYAAHGDTHDIYLNDMRKTRPENYRAIMRVRVHSLS